MPSPEPGREQFHRVADRAHQSPLSANVLLAAQAEAAKTMLFLDLLLSELFVVVFQDYFS